MHKYQILLDGNFIGAIYAHHHVIDRDMWKFYQDDNSIFHTCIFVDEHVTIEEIEDYYKNYTEALEKNQK